MPADRGRRATPERSVTFSLRAVLECGGVSKVLPPALSAEEAKALAASAAAIREALASKRFSRD